MGDNSSDVSFEVGNSFASDSIDFNGNFVDATVRGNESIAMEAVTVSVVTPMIRFVISPFSVNPPVSLVNIVILVDSFSSLMVFSLMGPSAGESLLVSVLVSVPDLIHRLHSHSFADEGLGAGGGDGVGVGVGERDLSGVRSTDTQIGIADCSESRGGGCDTDVEATAEKAAVGEVGEEAESKDALDVH